MKVGQKQSTGTQGVLARNLRWLGPLLLAFALRISDGVDSPIMAQVVILEGRNGERLVERSIMVSADLVHLPMEMVEAVRERVTHLIPGLDPRKLFISTTHTHQAPVVMRDNFILPEGVMSVGEYIDFFVERVVEAIKQAHERMQRGSVAFVRRGHEGAVAVVISFLYIGPMCNECSHNSGMATLCCHEQGSFTIVVLCITARSAR